MNSRAGACRLPGGGSAARGIVWQTVHLRFASELKYVNLGSRDIVAIKAREPFDLTTSISCLEATEI